MSQLFKYFPGTQSVILCLSFILIVGFFRVFQVGIHNPSWMIFVLIFSTAYSIILLGFRYSEVSEEMKIIIRSLSICCTLYIIFSHPAYLPPNSIYFKTILEFYFYITIAAGIISFWRPSFSLLPFVYIPILKTAIEYLSKIPISKTDYAVVVETGMFSLLAISTIWILKQSVGYLPALKLSKSFAFDKQKLGNFILFILISIHFSNYFYAGYAKLMLDGPFLSWLSNETYNIMYQSLLIKTVPLQQSDWAKEKLAWLLEFLCLPSNLLVLILQITTPLALIHRKAILLYTVFFDFMHVFIFLSTGIFFWKWIILNTIIIICLRERSIKNIPPSLSVLGVIICVGAPKIFYIPELGWYDTREGNATYFKAVLQDDRVVTLPSNYFRNYSITLAQQRLFLSSFSHKDVNSLGASLSWEKYKDTYDCNVLTVQPLKIHERNEALVKLTDFIQNYHEFALTLANQNGRYFYDFFPHHVWSNPYLFSKASNIDIRNIRAYIYTVMGYCIKNLERGRFVVQETSKESFLIPIF